MVRAYLDRGGDLDGLATLLAERRLGCTDVGVLAAGGAGEFDALGLGKLAAAVASPLCTTAVFEPTPRTASIRDLYRAADILGPQGCRLALEHTPFGGVPSLMSAVDICMEVGHARCGVLLDTWHFFRSGAPWEYLESLAGEQIALVHVNDGAPPLEAPVVESRFRRLPLGEGTFDLARFASTLDAIGYRGPIAVEVLSTELRRLHPRESAARLAQSLSAWPG